MADWKKIVVSGSDAELNQLSLTSDLTAILQQSQEPNLQVLSLVHSLVMVQV